MIAHIKSLDLQAEIKSQEHFNDEKLLIGPSHVHGHGVFANREISAGEIFEYQSRPAHDHELDSPYIIWDEKGNNPRIVQCLFKFINHSVNANVSYTGDGEIEVLRDIEPGDELFHNYDGE